MRRQHGRRWLTGLVEQFQAAPPGLSAPGWEEEAAPMGSGPQGPDVRVGQPAARAARAAAGLEGPVQPREAGQEMAPHVLPVRQDGM